MRNRFKLLVHESTGQAYEDLFVKIMTYSDNNFKSVKPHGNIGDRGNDGWTSKYGKYYQCYAPDDLPANTEKAIQKLKDDFCKLKEYWSPICPVKEFVFVVNDKFKGVSPHISKALDEMRLQYNLSSVDMLLASDLERILFELEQDKIIHVLGGTSPGATSNQNDFYRYIVSTITDKMYLNDWIRISDNLIANCIDDFVIEGLSDLNTIVFRTNFPGTYPSFDKSVIELSSRVQFLIDHFTKSKHAYLTDDSKWWRQDRRWKKTIHPQDVYAMKWNESDQWRKKLLDIHINLVHAMNLYADQVRKFFDPAYFMNQSFVLSDSFGTYNNMEGYQLVPTGFVEEN